MGLGVQPQTNSRFLGGWVFSLLNQAHGSAGLAKSPGPVPAQPGPREETTKQDTNFGSPAGGFFPRGPARHREGTALNCSWFQVFSLLPDRLGPTTPAPHAASFLRLTFGLVPTPISRPGCGGVLPETPASDKWGTRNRVATKERSEGENTPYAGPPPRFLSPQTLAGRPPP